MMTIDASQAAASVVNSLRSRPWGVAVAVLANGVTELALDPGADNLDEDSYFQIASVTKTMTGLLVADCVVRGEASLDSTVGAILGDRAGNCAGVTLLGLAAQHSGLPRLPPNLDPAKVDRQNPYASYTEAELLDALRLVGAPTPAYGYSNFGFMLLGLLLGRITGVAYADLVRERLFAPLGMTKAMCGLPPAGGRMPGYAGTSQTPWWTSLLPGAGEVACGIRDLAHYIAACISPPAAMAAAFQLALGVHAQGPPVMGLAWVHQGERRAHNGASGGFRSFVEFHAPTSSGIAVLVNGPDANIDRVGSTTLAELIRSRTEATA